MEKGHSIFPYSTSFESLGANCEFGFFLSRCGDETGTAFRWTDIPSSDALVNALDQNLAGMFEFEHLRPFNAGMVLDTATGIGWHSRIQSRLIDAKKTPNPENFEFTTSEDERKKLWEDQFRKVQYLVDKTRTSLKSNSKIFVFKPIKKDRYFDLSKAKEIFEALKRHGSSKLLVVTEAALNDTIGTVEEIEPGFLHGIIDRFAPGANARDISFEGWLQLCERAYRLIVHGAAAT